jgi:uncharacterized protein YdhG (YjbR/CyaY superfamily)
MKTKFETVTEYLAQVPKAQRPLIEALRKAIKETAPDAEEVISYNMPGFRWNGMLVWYAACKEHIGFYPHTNAINVFAGELKKHKTSKGAIQFPNATGIPVGLVKKIVKFRIMETKEKLLAKQKSKTTKK